MARARNIKPGFFLNHVLARCSHAARLVFCGLWCLADREGRLEDCAERIKVQLMPYDRVDMNKLLDELHTHGFIVRYQAQGIRCIQVTNFLKHQNPHHKEKESLIPALGSALDLPRTSPELTLLNPESLILNPESLTTAAAVETEIQPKATPSRSSFTPPTLDEVRAYISERGSRIDPELFHAHYEANGWVQGRGKPLKNWRAAITTWEKNDLGRSQSVEPVGSLASRYLDPNSPEAEAWSPF